MTTKMTVKKCPAVWRLSAGAWCVDIARSEATDAILRQGRPAAYEVTTTQTQVSMETRTGTHTSTRTDVVSRRVITALGTLDITADMILI